MRKKNAGIKFDIHLLKALEKIPFPLVDKKHGFTIYADDGRARSNEKRSEHLIKRSHELRVSDIELIKDGINNYFAYKKDSIRKETYSYYLKRKGNRKGFIKVTIRIDNSDKKKAWIKTLYISYVIK